MSCGTRRLHFVGEVGAGRGTLFVHGAGSSAALWREVVRPLASRGRWPCIAVDLPGHGRSDGPPCAGIEEIASVLRELIVALRLERPLCVGHSMGAAAAMELALRYPGDLGGLAVVGASARFGELSGALGLLVERPGAFERWFARRATGPGTTPREAERLVAAAITAPRASVRADFEACAAWSAVERVDRLRLPVLAVTGEGDLLTPPEVGRSLAARLERGSHSAVPGAGHLLPVEAPEALAEILSQWASRLGMMPTIRGFLAD